MKTNIFLDPVRGLLINYFPEEPTYCATGPLSSVLCRSVCNTMTDGNCTCVHIQSEYEAALSTAKREAVPLADQEEGKRAIWNSDLEYFTTPFNAWQPEPGKLYPVDVKWEKKDIEFGEPIPGPFGTFFKTKEVAYLLPSEEVVPVLQSQEELSYNDYLEITGAGKNNIYARKIYERIKHNGYKITKSRK
jgi:hypothetical protein